MTPDRFDRPLSSWLNDEAAMGAPDDLLITVLDQAARTRRRPGWATSERWISMETRAQLGAVPRTAIILAIVGLLIILAAATFAAGSGETRLDPTGPADNGLMAYTSDGDIWVVSPVDGVRDQLTSAPSDDRSPVWSRDGTRLAYWSIDPSGAPSELIVIDADGSDPVPVFSDDEGRTSPGIDWSPDDGSIAFALCPEEMCGELFVVASDGSAATSVGGPAFESYGLAWSPDGTTLAFGGRHNRGPLGVYLMAPDGSSVRRISQEAGLEGFVSVEWSADGSHLVTHAASEASGLDIWVISADGTGDRNLTDRSGTGFLPGWSPDDRWIAFREASTVFVVPATGGDIRRIGTGESWAWSPDAKMLALEGPGGVQLIDIDTGDRVAQVDDVTGMDSWQRVAPS